MNTRVEDVHCGGCQSELTEIYGQRLKGMYLFGPMLAAKRMRNPMWTC